ncbi:hypothetical protein ACKZDW_25455 [Ralstonia syzygii subsp. celebesensis]|uniref:hypothetical protein n=1 Tax=Ralstonia syzygii TaxID=28097 RepID=UPI00387E0D17
MEYAATGTSTCSGGAQVSKSNVVGTIPFLYHGATAGRLDRAYGHALIGAWFSAL